MTRRRGTALRKGSPKSTALYGVKEGQQRRGRKPHYTELYPTRLLGGLVCCGECVARLHQRGHGTHIYLGCPNALLDTCNTRSFVPIGRANEAIVGFLGTILLGTPEWIESVRAVLDRTVTERLQRVPDQIANDERQLRETDEQIRRLVDSLATGQMSSDAIRARLRELEDRAAQLRVAIDAERELRPSQSRIPDNLWINEQLGRLLSVLQEESQSAGNLLRKLLDRIEAHAQIAPGKTRGYMQLRFRVNYRAAICECLSADARRNLERLMGNNPAGLCSDEIRLDLGGPTRMDALAPQIAEMRARNVKWEEIAEITGLDIGNACVAYRRFILHGNNGASVESNPASSTPTDDSSPDQTDAA